MAYKVSYVVVGSDHPGAIINHVQRPKVGDKVTIGRQLFEVEEIHEMMSSRSDFHFLHATVRRVSEPSDSVAHQED